VTSYSGSVPLGAYTLPVIAVGHGGGASMVPPSPLPVPPSPDEIARGPHAAKKAVTARTRMLDFTCTSTPGT